MEKMPFEFLDELIVRSPVFPFKPITDIAELYQLLQDRFFLESIFIASPLLYEECEKLKAGIITSAKEKDKVIKSLYRYYTRMQSRSTPFGLFSTCGIAHWGDQGTTRQYPADSFRRYTRLDIHLLHKFIVTLSSLSSIKPLLKYYPNNSIYTISDEIRYIEHTYFNGYRKYKISGVVNNRFIDAILKDAEHGMNMNEIMLAIGKLGVGQQDAADFIDNMISSQLLVSEFEVYLTSKDDLTAQILNLLRDLYRRSGDKEIDDIATAFNQIMLDLRELDNEKINDISTYRDILNRLRDIQPVIDESKTFHIDSFRSAAQTVNSTIKDELLELLVFLRDINMGSFDINPKLNLFKSKFLQKFESQSLKLAEALDSDFGIGYPVDKGMTSAPFVDDIPFQQSEADSTIVLSQKDKWLLKILRDPANKGAEAIYLDQQGDNIVSSKEWKAVPLSISAMFRVTDDQETLLFEGFFGPSAGSLIARFTHGNEAINKIAQKIVEKEEKAVDNCVFAEIVHMPDNRVTNVIMHPPLRKYEIPYLAQPSVSASNTIDLNDIYIKIVDDQIILFSERLNKRIIPCKTHMHNHVANSLPLYHFLSDLQSQEANRIINFSWGSLLQLFTYFPRVLYKKIILSPAMWIFPVVSKALTDEQEPEPLMVQVSLFRTHHNLPAKVLYSEGDNELLVDFTNLISVQTWLGLIRNKTNILLKEFLWINEEPGTENYVNQYVASIINLEKKEYALPFNPSALPKKSNGVQREFVFGSKWMYLKYYCGTGSADIILAEAILPAIHQLYQAGLIVKWFFIKYGDPDFHIRLRIELKDAGMMSQVLQLLNDTILNSGKKTLISKTNPDTYIREVERYGDNTVEICESIFCIDSMITLELLKGLTKANNEVFKSLWGLRLVDRFLDNFKMSLENKFEFVNLVRQMFQAEFKSNKKTTERINLKYNDHKDLIKDIMDDSSKYTEISNIIQQKTLIVQPFIDQIMKIYEDHELQVDMTTLMTSLIHMMLNRLITNKERIHELVIYEFLYKYYNMKINIAKKSAVAQAV